LALVKELVELHHGVLHVQSEEGNGSKFTICFPVGKDHLKKDEISETPTEQKESNQAVLYTDEIDAPHHSIDSDPSGDSDEGDTLILIIEDHADVRTLIRQTVQNGYRIIEASDGEQGIEKAIEHIPDLIICDVMMPVKDGYQVCSELKTDERTSHIPVILLTAKAASEEKITGLETGADDYLTKPFDSKELLARVKNLVELRKNLRKRFTQKVILKPSEISTNSTDQGFLEKALKLIEENMDNENFDMNDLMRGLGMSRTQLFRKIKALTNQTVSQFIQSIRLQRAAELLQKGTTTIAEIAFQVGFEDPSFFTRAFKKHFGSTPSEFIKNKK